MLVATRLDGRLGNQLNHAVNLRRFEDRLRGKWAVITSDPHAPVVCLYVEDDTGALAPSHHQLAPRHKAPLLMLAVDGSTGDGRLVPASPVPPVWEAMSDRCQAVPSEHDTPTHQADLPVLLFIGKHDAMLLSSAAALCVLAFRAARAAGEDKTQSVHCSAGQRGWSLVLSRIQGIDGRNSLSPSERVMSKEAAEQRIS
ncbi:MAG: hypothetical protein LC776_02790 [Acidobacteria bacterium]|nr:hypothetical protein [Acidobacteriota bacterium]